MPGPIARDATVIQPTGLTARKSSYAELAVGTTTLVLDASYPNRLKLVATGGQTTRLPSPESAYEGVTFEVTNGAGGAHTITVTDQAESPNTITTIAQNTHAAFYCDGTEWELIAKHTIALS
jgi:hypothetical protein